MKTVTEYRDLSKYQFLHFENALNIGWHNNKQKVVMSEINYIDNEFLRKLKIHCDQPLNKVRCGKHRCFELNGKKQVEGFGEIRILDLDNHIRYASPNIIYRDILDGFYVPTIEFVFAVKNAPLPNDKIYTNFISRYTREYFYGESEDLSRKIKSMILEINNGNSERYFNEFPNMIDTVTENGSILNILIMKSQDKEVEFILNTDFNLNAFQGAELLSAIEMKKSCIAKLLIHKNIEIVTNQIQTNPLFSAIRYGEIDIAKQLILTRKDTIRNYESKPTLIEIAEKYNNLELIELITKLV